MDLDEICVDYVSSLISSLISSLPASFSLASLACLALAFFSAHFSFSHVPETQPDTRSHLF